MIVAAHIEEDTVPVQSEPALIEEIPLITMVEPMPGFPATRGFALVRLDESGVLCALRCVDAPGLRFLVVPPAAFFDDYAPVVDEQVLSLLGAQSPDDLLVLTVVTPGERAEDATANLLAPILVNAVNRRACQVILNEDLPVRARLVA